MKIRKTVTIEFDRVKITTVQHCKKMLWCEFCQAESEFLDQNAALNLTGFLESQGLSVNQKNLHFYRSNEEQTLVCFNSIIKSNDPVIF